MAVGPTKTSIQWISGGRLSSPGGKARPGRDAKHSPPSCAKTKNGYEPISFRHLVYKVFSYFKHIADAICISFSAPTALVPVGLPTRGYLRSPAIASVATTRVEPSEWMPPG
jgi:hypothetical protein